jgi:hypothetical protein
MNQELHHFIKDYIELLQEKYNQSLIQTEQAEHETDVAFAQGTTFAYYDALDLLKAQLESFGYEVKESELLNLPEFGKAA